VRVLLQRVTRAAVTIGGQPGASIGPGLLLFVGVAQSDTGDDARYLLDKTVNLRIFPDEQGRFDRSILDVRGSLLIVSQFTLFAETRKGRRPSFTAAAPPEQAAALVEQFVTLARATGLRVETGRFQEHMLVDIENDGPVTILIDSADRHSSRSGEPKTG
jgi:D-tyrosyl-tRNA(Tyr) deacylase